jgi:hypothetical protein
MAILAVGFTAALTGVAQAAPVAPPPVPPAVAKNYVVTVHTGNRSNAGTDGNVFLRLYGTRGVSPEVQLDDSEDNFERNKYDRFNFRFRRPGHADEGLRALRSAVGRLGGVVPRLGRGQRGVLPVLPLVRDQADGLPQRLT